MVDKIKFIRAGIPLYETENRTCIYRASTMSRTPLGIFFHEVSQETFTITLRGHPHFKTEKQS